MLIEERLKEFKDKINEKVPRGITVSQVEFEGPELVIYTDDPKRFADEADLIKIIARDLRKRIVVRPTQGDYQAYWLDTESCQDTPD
jgi:predicted metal-dependent RNase